MDVTTKQRHIKNTKNQTDQRHMESPEHGSTVEDSSTRVLTLTASLLVAMAVLLVIVWAVCRLIALDTGPLSNSGSRMAAADPPIHPSRRKKYVVVDHPGGECGLASRVVATAVW